MSANQKVGIPLSPSRPVSTVQEASYLFEPRKDPHPWLGRPLRPFCHQFPTVQVSHSTCANMTTAQLVLPPLETSIISIRNVLVFAGLWLAYHVLKAFYNISSLHPLSGIPGPKLAAATYLPEFYYDVVKYGCYTKEISKMHEKYGKLNNSSGSRTLAV